jgi:hypothetical protein
MTKSTMRICIFSSSIILVVLAFIADISPSHGVEVEISPSGGVTNDSRDRSNGAGSPSSSSKGKIDNFSVDEDNSATTSALLMPSDPQVLRARAIFEWIHHQESNDEGSGGFINEKQTIRRANKDDITSHIGVFASQSIQKGELLAQIPWSLVIQSDNPEERGQLPCGTGE